MKKAQTWSLDAMIAVGMFVIVIMSFFYIVSQISETGKTDELVIEGRKIQDSLISSGSGGNLNIIVGNAVDEKGLNNLAEKDYEKLKREFGVRGDFCIHFEDDDGNIIYINETTKRVGIGSNRVRIDGTCCS